MPCPLCGGSCKPSHSSVPDFEHGLPKRSDFFACGSCGLVFQEPQPNLQDLLSYYPTDYRPHVSGPGGLLGFLKGLQSRFLVRRYARWMPKDRSKRILDLGCGSGQFLRALSRAGYQDLVGVDRNPGLAAAFEGTSIRYLSMELEPTFRLPERYHTIVMNYVLEHFLDPARVLQQCRDALEDGGQILILTPNVDSWSHRLFGRYWSGLHAPRHPRLFGPRSLDLLARKLGFREGQVAFVTDPASWAFSFQNWVQSGTEHLGVARGTAWYSLALLPFWYPIATLERAAGKGSSIAVAFRA